MPRRASISAMSCGVETMTAPVSGVCCALVSWASPVPGGRSTTRISRSPHATSRSICVIAEITIGPRQIMARSSSTRKPMDITLTPKRSMGSSMRGPTRRGLPRRPNSFGCEGPYTSASRMPVFSPIAAKPSARLHEVVDLPTPPLPEATAMTCLTPGMPAALEVARACRSGWMADTACSLRSEGIAFLRIACAQIILGGHDGRTLRRRMRVEALVDDSFDAAIRAQLDDVEPLGVGALEHPVLLAELGEHALNRAPGAKGLAAGNAKKRLFLLQHAKRRVPGLEIKPRFKGDDLFRTARFAKPALHAQTFGKSQHRAVRIVRERRRRTGGDTGMAERATLDVDIDAAERRPRRQWHDIDRRGRGQMQFAKRGLKHAALGAARHKAGRLLRRDANRCNVEHGAQLVRIVGLDDPHQAR